MIRSAREVFDAISVVDCEPRSDLLADGTDSDAYLLADPGREYALYYPDGGSAALDALAIDRPLACRWDDRASGPADRERLVSPGQWVAVVA